MTSLTEENYQGQYLRFQDRQAGVSVSYAPDLGKFVYTAYCLETKLLKQLLSVEFEFLEDALDYINTDFGTWEVGDFGKEESGCGNCSAKKN